MAEEKAGKLGFVDSIVRLVRGGAREEGPAAGAPGTASFEAVEASLEAALRELEEKVAAQTREKEREDPERRRQLSGEELAAELRRRTEAAHEAIRKDIVAMHARLGTGIGADDLSAIVHALEEFQALVDAGRGSYALLARARCAIAERLQREAGELAVDDLVRRLERHGIAWPDPISHHPSATPADIEAARRRRLREMREVFLSTGFQKTADRMLGIVRGWGSDYPARGSALWEESVLEGVVAGMRGKLVVDFVEVLRQDRGEILSQVEALVGKDLEALRSTLHGGVSSLEQASRAASSALRVLDDAVPQIAWERVCAQLPHARGET